MAVALDAFLEDLFSDTSISVKPKQLQALQSILKGKDTLCILPTGFGKSLIYQMIPASFTKMFSSDDFHVSRPTVIVLSPLTSLISNQVSSANKLPHGLGISAAAIDLNNFDGIKSGKYNLLFGTPESFITVQKWRDMLCTEYFATNVVCIVVDEVHKVCWGESTKLSMPFREAFSRINELRSIIKQDLPILALSATVDVDITKLVMASCSLSQNVEIITEVIDRQNITLHRIPLKSKSSKPLHWILEGLKHFSTTAPKVIIYCRSVQLLGWLYEQFLISGVLPKHKIRKHIVLFHSTTFQDEKDKILNALIEETDLRVVIATSALGCGVDMKNVMFVVHFGPAYDTVDFCQQIGRAGRSGSLSITTMCHAILYIFPQYGEISLNMKGYLNTNQCLRVKLFSPFNSSDSSISPLIPAHSCCSVCAKVCSCCSENLKSTPFLSHEYSPSTEPFKNFRKVTKEDEELVRDLLNEYHRSTAPAKSILMEPHFISGISAEIIDEVISFLPFIDSIEFMINNFSVSDRKLIYEIMVIINNVFDDIPLPKMEFEDEKFANYFNSFSLNDEEYIFSNDEFDWEELFD